jgi:hypothetical protein
VTTKVIVPAAERYTISVVFAAFPVLGRLLEFALAKR